MAYCIGATPFSHGFTIFYFVNLIVEERDLNTRYLRSKHHEVPVELPGPLLIPLLSCVNHKRPCQQ